MSSVAPDSALASYLLGIGDDALVLGQRLAEWSGRAPMLELDLALMNICLDQLGQAELLLRAAASELGQGDADTLAFNRDALDFRNCLLTEQPNGDFARTVVRQLIFSRWQGLLFRHLQSSKHPPLAEIALKVGKEISYHQRFASEWAVRMGKGTSESRRRLEAAIIWCGRFVEELFEVEPDLEDLIAASIAADPRAFKDEFNQAIAGDFNRAGIQHDRWPAQVSGGRRGHHSEHLGHLLAELQFLQRAYPGAQW